MLAIIKTGGKQYIVKPGDKIKVEKLWPEADKDNITFDKVLLVGSSDTDAKIGAPFVSGAKVEAKIVKHGKHDKVIVFKFHHKSRYRKKKGHRQQFTELEITKIA